ncbi:MAG: hypothetical protein AAF716_17855 [Cyanobacteria bacterium P01_D01_bin.1]
MQYLAKVYSKQSPSRTQIQLLAKNSAENLWETIVSQDIIETAEKVPFNEQALVIVEIESSGVSSISGKEQVVGVTDATNWILTLVEDYLSLGVTPQYLQSEAERAEQWRQSLTLQSQEVRRRSLETAARRDEIQNLEKRLKLEREATERQE